MRIVINGWFLDQVGTGSGQYVRALLEWLPRVGGEHEFVVVQSANRRSSEAANDRSRNRRSPIRNSTARDASNPQYAIHSTQYSVTTPFDRLNPDLAKLWFEQIAFPLACRRLQADVAFVPYWGSPWWSPCPVVVTVHDLIPLLLPRYRGGPLRRAYTWLVSRTARRAAAVLTDSEASRRDIVARLGIPPGRVHAIYLAADPRYRPVADPAELARVRKKYDLPDAPFLFYLGGFDARKNVTRMIEAYARAVSHQPSAGRLVIAGRLPEADTPFAPDPRPVVARLGLTDRVHFTGPVDEADKPALYSLALATVFVSEYEGFGLPVVEAMGCETRTGPS